MSVWLYIRSVTVDVVSTGRHYAHKSSDWTLWVDDCLTVLSLGCGPAAADAGAAWRARQCDDTPSTAHSRRSACVSHFNPSA